MRRAFLIALALGGTAAKAQDHAGHSGHAAAAQDSAGPADAPAAAPAPAAPEDHAADAYYAPAIMEKARAQLRHESGGMPHSMLLIDRLEWRPGPERGHYEWEVEGWSGGDIDRLALKSKGNGGFGDRPEKIELQAGWLHALDPWFNIRAGVRQDLQPRPHRTQAVLAIEGLAPYWFHVEGELFLSQKGEITARAEASYDQRITQTLILQPQMELNLSAQDVPELEMGAGFTSIETGLRLRYEFVREFAPYVGVSWDRTLGQTARYRRDEGRGVGGARFVAGVRFWF